ncbi:TetR/AcrR family transcriptional regulator [Radiobacillus deserti]|uniref:TetR/AcrR family transcriptional regulator n=1 Tax=Radiobacillus deserti TaxID=2594883 RepID=A0A516KC06_9BACI|nr:TetR/AcrR family transcriptional regulator [Radiobacillus deserti]QDP38920.1 TetR/AcrR family transcriptional regulator [Radiobacillus deserti]
MSPKVSQEHLEQRRTNILEAAKQVFRELGYEKTTMKDVMEAAGVSRGGLYHYFSNKEDLFEAILAEALQGEVTHTDTLLQEKVDSYWHLLLTRVFGDDITIDDSMDPLASVNLEFFITGKNDDRRRAFAYERYYNGKKLYQNIIEAGQKHGEFSKQYDASVIAQSIITFIDGLALDHALLPAEDVRVKQQSELFVDYLKMALGVKKGES